MIDSISLHVAQVRAAKAASAAHVANPNSGCICHKCESARADERLVSAHAVCEWTYVPEGVYCDTHEDWVIFGR